MKRPLFAVCLAITCVIALCYWLYPPSLPARVPAETEEVLIYGRIERKENRYTYGKEQFILYLSDYSIYSSDSEPDKNLLWANSAKQEGNQIICYTASTDWEPKTGSFVLVRGNSQDFSRATNPGEFDSRLYYATLGIDFCVKNAEIEWESEAYSVFKESLWNLRCYWQERLDTVLDEGASQVMRTMLLGDKAALDKEVKALYQDGGIAHILAISGLHISMIGMGLYQLLRKIGVPIWISAVVGSVCIFAYGIMTGAGVSTGRAVGMFLIRMLAELLGRSYDMLTALGVLLFLMVLGQPLYLYHSGFLLSFSALFGIGLLRPALEMENRESRRAEKYRYREGFEKRLSLVLEALRKNFMASVSVTMTTLPITFVFYYEMPVYGALLNLIVLPLMPAVMYSGMGLLLLPEGVWLHIPVALVEVILAAFEWLCEGSLNLPGQSYVRGKPEVWQICVYVILLIVIVWGKKRATRKRESLGNGDGPKRRCIPRKWRFTLLLVAVLLMCGKVRGGTKITFLDVGQGDSICIQTENGNAYLVDCGSSSKSNVGKYIVVPFFKYEGISFIEAVVITHPDKDHCNGLEGLLQEGYAGRIGTLLLPDISQKNKDESYLELESLAATYGIEVNYLSAGMRWQDGDVTFTCLHPGREEGTGGNDGVSNMNSNAYSVVLHVESGDFSALLAGDVEDVGEEQLTEVMRANGINEVTVLKVAHHGSRYSTTESFLEALDAQMAVISCGENNNYGHPHEETLRRLKEDGTVILTTLECGAVTMEIGNGIKVRVWKQSD